MGDLNPRYQGLLGALCETIDIKNDLSVSFEDARRIQREYARMRVEDATPWVEPEPNVIYFDFKNRVRVDAALWNEQWGTTR